MQLTNSTRSQIKRCVKCLLLKLIKKVLAYTKKTKTNKITNIQVTDFVSQKIKKQQSTETNCFVRENNRNSKQYIKNIKSTTIMLNFEIIRIFYLQLFNRKFFMDLWLKENLEIILKYIHFKLQFGSFILNSLICK